QAKVGSFFKQLDQTITLHQRKLDKLQELKKAALQSFFPKKDELMPKVRFANFEGVWKQRKLSQLADIVGGGTPNTKVKEYWGGNIDWYSPKEIGNENYIHESQKKITKLGLKKSSTKLLPANQTILFTSRAGIGDMAILKNSGTTNQGFQSIVVNKGNDTYFIYSYGDKIKKEAIKFASGSTFLEITGKELGKIQLKLPSLTEQQKVSSFFTKLDTIISYQQTKLGGIEKLKKAFLQKMFI
ncbi:MAG: restriction endonuclease subunit S, partial [Lactococcus lactis]|nr:restriction endonuclease subunit S [Lactococcus lactis]